MPDLFDKQFKKSLREEAPLADRMRPRDFKYFFGQKELINGESPLQEAIENDSLTSLIFWGPPGSGKTTLARIIATKTKAYFAKFSAVISGIKDIRAAIASAQERRKFSNQKTILFIDEIHRFNKAQQDALLPYVEDGTIILIGATTENPSFEVISPLLSRSAVYVLKSLDEKALQAIIQHSLKDEKRGLGKLKLKLDKKAMEKLIHYADGDARAALNGLEMAANYLKKSQRRNLSVEILDKIIEKQAFRYDKKGEEHYNIISAFIKSMRDSDPNGALYWLARMIKSGEDPRFIARRMIVFASEDIGNADFRALLMANAVAHAVEYVGLPEAQINLAQGTTYLATAKKSNRSYIALQKAFKDADKGSYGVPLHLRNAVTSLMKDLKYGKDYKYAHKYEDGHVQQKHFPKEIGEQNYY